jgi:hypothetical protein
MERRLSSKAQCPVAWLVCVLVVVHTYTHVILEGSIPTLEAIFLYSFFLRAEFPKKETEDMKASTDIPTSLWEHEMEGWSEGDLGGPGEKRK